MKQLSLLIVLFVGLTTGAFAQDHNHFDPGHMTCYKNEVTEAYFDAHPEQREVAEQESRELERFTRDFIEMKDGEDDPIIIPVVFHVMHVGGNENISDDQIHSAIDVLNEDFNAANSDIGNVVDEFSDVVGDVNFEFRLAKKDPQGNCTNGINRVFSETTFDGFTDMKDAAPTWGRASYLNIWVCSQIGDGVAGYAFLPPGAPVAYDGIVILHNYTGRIGTSNASRSHALSHEVGHWANLEHTWGGGQPGNSGNCGDDDGVPDTPQTIGWTNCTDIDGATCGSTDNVENFMDYSYCYKMFTQGQAVRMTAAVNSSISQRNQVHSEANLIETGVLDADVICAADFITDRDPTICVGQEITFDDISFNGVENRSWTFEGGTPASSSEDLPVVTYSAPGFYNVTLTVSNTQGEETVSRTDFIHVVESPQYSLPFQEGFDQISEIGENDEWVDINQDGSNISWQVTDLASLSGNQSVSVRGRNNEDYQVEILESPTFDLSGIEDNAVLSFKYAHARRNSSSDDLLRVRISRNCGESWNLRETRDIDELPTVSGSFGGQFIPDSDDDWEEVIIDNISTIFLNPEFRIRFEFTSVKGNNIFIDDINIYDPNTLSVDNSDVVKNLNLYPNPASDFVNVRLDLDKNQNVRIDVVDATGRVVRSPFNGFMASGSQQFQINLGTELAEGIYFVRLTAEDGIAVRKLVLR